LRINWRNGKLVPPLPEEVGQRDSCGKAATKDRYGPENANGEPVRFGLFALLTICGFLIFALTMTFAPVLPMWGNYAARAGFLAIFGTLWWVARDGHPLSRFRPVFFAYFTAVLGLSLGFFFADRGLKLFGLTTQTPVGIAMAKFLQASLIVIGILAVARLCGEDLASLYIRKGRLLLGLSVGFITAGALLVLGLLQPAVRALGTAKVMSLAPWVLLFVVSNAFLEELLFRGLFLGRYQPLIGKWLAILSTALAFTLAHMQVSYAPNLWAFLLVTFGFSIAWGWLMQKTESLWGSALFHAGADLLIILPIFSSLGAV
jgi:membrane protease YdiL (CAAX protease family)